MENKSAWFFGRDVSFPGYFCPYQPPLMQGGCGSLLCLIPIPSASTELGTPKGGRVGCVVFVRSPG